jgi:uroporphyrinogen decarboxylase
VSNNAEVKIKRVLDALNFKEPDRIPRGEWFWGGFVDNFKKYKSISAGKTEGFFSDMDIIKYFDLDIVLVQPNIDPHIKNFETIEETKEHIIIKTGFEATIKKIFNVPMPMYLEFETDTVEKIQKFEFDDPKDKRRFFSIVDDQVNGVGDGFIRATNTTMDRIDTYKNDYCVFGGACDVFEYLWRIIGSERALMLLATDPEVMKEFSGRITDFQIGFIEEQVRVANGALNGIYIFGDVAYKKSLLFSPKMWVSIFKPCLKRMCDCVHGLGLKVIWHGCGNVEAILDDLIDAGIDCYNSIEAKTGLDVVKLKKKYGTRLAYNGNISIPVLENGTFEDIKKEVLYKLNAAKGGGYIFQTDHSVSSAVPPQNYDYAIELLNKYGRYPLKLGEFDIEM